MALSCGMDCIKIPFKSALGVGIVGTIMILISVCLSDILCQYIPSKICDILCCAVLCAMGGMNIIKSMIEKYRKYISNSDKSSIIDVYICGSCADCDHSKEVSLKEAIVVSFIMSLDSLVTGVVSGNNLNIILVCVSTLIFQTITVWLGSIIGLKTSKLFDFSLIGGFLLIILGIFKMI